MRKVPTQEEKFAKKILEKYIYKDTKLINCDKPDIQSLHDTVGIEHMLITTATSEMQTKMKNIIGDKHVPISEAIKVHDIRFHKAKHGYIINDNSKVIGLLSFPNETLLEMIEKAFEQKYPKINDGSYKQFDKYDLFLTLHNDWIINDNFSKITSLIEEYNKKFETHYHRVFILKSYSLLVFKDSTCTEIYFDNKKLIKKWY